MLLISAPTIITGMRPMVSTRRPLKGREISAISVNSEMLRPRYCSPPSAVRKVGSSGIIMLKLLINMTELRHINTNCRVNSLGSAAACSSDSSSISVARWPTARKFLKGAKVEIPNAKPGRGSDTNCDIEIFEWAVAGFFGKLPADHADFRRGNPTISAHLRNLRATHANGKAKASSPCQIVNRSSKKS